MSFKSACTAIAAAAFILPHSVAFADESAAAVATSQSVVDITVLREKAEALRTKSRLAAASPGGRETAASRTSEATRLLGYAARLDALADEVESARITAQDAEIAQQIAERAAIDKIELIRTDAGQDNRDSVLGDLITTVNFTSGTDSRPLDIAFCIQTDGYAPEAFRDLIQAELTSVLSGGGILIAPVLEPIDKTSLHITASVPAGDTKRYLSVMDDVRAGVLDAAMKSERPGRAQASVLSGDLAAEACARSVG